MKLLTVAQLQTRVYAQKETNLSLLDGLFCQAKDAGADMICLPEMFSCPYETPNFPVYAEPGGGPSWQTLSGLAERYQVYLSAGPSQNPTKTEMSIIRPMSSTGRDARSQSTARSTYSIST